MIYSENEWRQRVGEERKKSAIGKPSPLPYLPMDSLYVYINYMLQT
jgi:hypothetical protein